MFSTVLRRRRMSKESLSEGLMYVQNAHISILRDELPSGTWERCICCWCPLVGGVVLFDYRGVGEVTACIIM